jgi:hypothetical protein
VSSPEQPYKTTILGGRVDVGNIGIRLVGVIWLLVGIAWLAAAAALAFRASVALPLVATVTTVSTLLCALEWPQARIGLSVNCVLLAAMPFLGAVVWQDGSSAMRRALTVSSLTTRHVFRSACLGVPPPVARYFRRALREGQPYVAAAELVQEGEFFVGNAWRPFRATQRFTAMSPGFTWDARIQMAPLLPVYVRDSYVAGSASMRGALLGIVPIVNAAGAPELHAAALHRYLAEAIWFPTALLPRGNVMWNAVDNHAGLATLTDRHTSVSLQFTFNDAGDVIEMFARDRFAAVNGRYEPRPWRGRCAKHAEHDGMRVPVECEVEWLLPEGPSPYWRGRLVDIRYEF